MHLTPFARARVGALCSTMALPGSSFLRPRGLAASGGGSAPWDSGAPGLAQAPAPSRFFAPPPRPAAADNFDSLDLLLGGGAGSVGPSKPQQRWGTRCLSSARCFAA